MSTQTIEHFFVVFQRFATGVEANVHPEETRSDIVKMLAEGQFKNVICIQEVSGGSVRDVTSALAIDAQLERMDAAAEAAEWLGELV